MSKIVGTIISIENYLEKDDVSVKINHSYDEKEIFQLLADRQYVIPYFQREIRWKKENLIELIGDINNGSKFLGNVILTKNNNLTYEIIDGQQRSTMLMMIVQYIKFKYYDRFTVKDTCPLNIESFKTFSELLENNFIMDNVDAEKKYSQGDEYNQLPRYQELWNVLKESPVLNTPNQAKKFYNNLNNSEINIIINTGDYNDAIGYFLDVNLKGVKLDTEDIFKGYLFGNDTSNKVRELWANIKQLTEKLKQCNVSYPMMKVLEHYLQCDLYLNKDYEKIEFSEEFLIKNTVEIEGTVHYVGQHIINVINNKSYMLSVLINVRQILEFIYIIVSQGQGATQYNDFFTCKEKIDDVEKKVIFNIMNNLIRDKNVLPNVLLVRYIKDVFIMQDPEKSDYRKIYSVFVLTVLFNIFENRKKSDGIYSIVKSKDWYEKAIDYINKYLTDGELGTQKVTIQYKYIADCEMSESQEFKCRTLAVIYNYFKISSNEVAIVKGKYKDVLEFFQNKSLFSLEHFIINNSGKFICEINMGNTSFKYIKEIIKYKNSLFNYIFIPEKINGSMGDLFLVDKIKYLKGYTDEIGCEFSRMVIDCIEKEFDFPEYSKDDSKEILDERLQSYFYMKFRNEYLKFANSVMTKFVDRCRK